jgi:hypothetical protein
MAGVVRLSAMAGGLTTPAHHGSNRTRAKIAQAQKILEKLGSVSL